MKKQFSILFVLIACFSFFSCKKEIADNNAAPAETVLGKTSMNDRSNNDGVPFKGTYATSHEVLQAPPIFIQRVTGAGNATHLGQSSFVSITTVDRSTPPPFAVSGTRTFTAANGDQLFTTFTGTSSPTGPRSSRADLHDVIVGGTGRFAHASGSFDGVAINDPTTSTLEVTFNGYIHF